MSEELLYSQLYTSPLGNIVIRATEIGLVETTFNASINDFTENHNKITALTVEQLEQYFEGKRKAFDLPLQPIGTTFQQKVWQQLVKISYGSTTTYLQQATNLGDVKAIRAMASANGKNPIAIIIPCHRVVGSDGSLTGYAGELWRKQWLLDHEAKVSGTYNKLF